MSAGFQWVPFSTKQIKILTWWTEDSPYKDRNMIIMEGSVRSAKTVTGSFSFVLWAMHMFNECNFAFCGKTISSCHRNIMRPLQLMLEAEPEFKFTTHRSSKQGEYIEIEYHGHKNYFWQFGGKDEGSQDLIQGFTLAGLFMDEVILYPMSFIQQARARLSVQGSKTWLTFNPQSPRDPFYTEFIDKLDPNKYYYIHLTLRDNPSLSDEKIEEYRTMWPIGSVYYRRYFLGERCAAEGRVFSFFSERVDDGYVVDQLPGSFAKYYISVDYGTKNPFVAILWGYSDGVWYALSEYVWDSIKESNVQKSNGEYIDSVANKLMTWHGNYIIPQRILIDPSATAFIVELRKQNKYRNIIGMNIRGADNDVVPGIQDCTAALTSGKLRIYKDCKILIDSIMGYCWDEKASMKGKDVPLKGGSGAPDHACFIGATQVETINGLKHIRDVKIGDMVLTRTGYKKVIDSELTDNNSEVYDIQFSDGNSITATSNHPIYIDGKGFIPVSELKSGDKVCKLNKLNSKENVSSVEHSSQLINMQNKLFALKDVEIVSIKKSAIKQPVYNLTVEDAHEYFANSILVSNCDCLRYFSREIMRAPIPISPPR
jgi:PBSX family phage terminase large subunit